MYTSCTLHCASGSPKTYSPEEKSSVLSVSISEHLSCSVSSNTIGDHVSDDADGSQQQSSSQLRHRSVAVIDAVFQPSNRDRVVEGLS